MCPLLKKLTPLTLALLTACGGSSGAVSNGSATANPTSTDPTPTVTPTTAPPPEPDPDPEPESPVEPDIGENIRLLVLYSESSSDLYSDPVLRITHLVNVTNQLTADSHMPLDLEIAHIERVNYPDGFSMVDALEAVTLNTDAAFNSVPALRNEHEADLVVLFRPYANDGLCGYAWVGAQSSNGDFSDPRQADFGFSTVAINCSDYTLAHELGHNLGLVHSRQETPEGGSLAHGAGYGTRNGFATIMADASSFNAIKLPVLSSPASMCQGEPCGVDRADPIAGADAVHAVGVAKSQVANYR